MSWNKEIKREINSNGQRVQTTVHSPKSMAEYRELLSYLYCKTGDTKYLKNVVDENYSRKVH